MPLNHRPDLALSEADAIDGGNELHHGPPWTRKFCLSEILVFMMTGTVLATIVIQAIFIMRLRADLQSKTLSSSMLPTTSVLDAEFTFSSRRSRSGTRFRAPRLRPNEIHVGKRDRSIASLGWHRGRPRPSSSGSTLVSRPRLTSNFQSSPRLQQSRLYNRSLPRNALPRKSAITPLPQAKAHLLIKIQILWYRSTYVSIM